MTMADELQESWDCIKTPAEPEPEPEPGKPPPSLEDLGAYIEGCTQAIARLNNYSDSPASLRFRVEIGIADRNLHGGVGSTLREACQSLSDEVEKRVKEKREEAHRNHESHVKEAKEAAERLQQVQELTQDLKKPV
jgi:hypothetical protein